MTEEKDSSYVLWAVLILNVILQDNAEAGVGGCLAQKFTGGVCHVSTPAGLTLLCVHATVAFTSHV